MRKKILSVVAALLLTAACSGYEKDGKPVDLTPRQKVVDVIGKAKAVGFIALQVVEDPAVPADVKQHVKAAAKGVREAVEAYKNAVKADQDTATFVVEALTAIQDLTNYLVMKGYISPEQAYDVLNGEPIYV